MIIAANRQTLIRRERGAAEFNRRIANAFRIVGKPEDAKAADEAHAKHAEIARRLEETSVIFEGTPSNA